MKLFSVAEAATELGVSPGLIYGLCQRKKLRHERHGLGRGTIRIPQDALEEYRKRVTVESAEQGGEPQSAPVPKPTRLRNLSLD